MTDLGPIGERLRKLKVLAARPGTPGERQAAEAAIARIHEAVSLTGLQLGLDRSCDRTHGCCRRRGVIRPGRGPHRYELRCTNCGRHRGWLKAAAAELLAAMQRDGRLRAPILRDRGIVP
jgi:hypothetical protein